MTATGSPRDFAGWMKEMERGLRNARRVGAQANARIDDIELTPLPGNPGAGSGPVPTFPVEVEYQTSVFWDGEQQKRWRGRIYVNFPPVTRSTDGQAITVSSYELQGYRPAGLENPDDAPLWTTYGYSPEPGFIYSDLIPGETYMLRVRAERGLWSEVFSATIINDTTPPPQPTAPQVQALPGVISVLWDRLAVTGAMPSDFSHIVVAAGYDPSPIAEVGQVDLGQPLYLHIGAPYYQPVFFRFQAVDIAGNRSPWSEQGTAFLKPLVDEDMIITRLDAAETQIVNAGLLLLDADQTLRDKFALSDQALISARDSLAALSDRVGPLESGLNTLATETIPALQRSASGKNSISRATNNPPATVEDPYTEGDTWERWSTLNNGGVLLQSWRARTGVWVEEKMDPTYLPKVDIGEGTFGSLSGGRLEVGSVSADKVMIGFGENFLVDPAFENDALNTMRTTGGNWTVGSNTLGDGKFLTSSSETTTDISIANSTRLEQFPVDRNSVWALTYEADGANQLSVYLHVTWSDGTSSSGPFLRSCPINADGSRTVGTVMWDWKTYRSNGAYPVSARLTLRRLATPAGSVNKPTNIYSLRLTNATGGELLVNGSVKADHLDTASVAAGLASIIKADIGNLTVTGTSNLNEVVAGRIFTNIFATNRLTTNHLLVGKGENFIPWHVNLFPAANRTWLPHAASGQSTLTIEGTGGRSGGPHLIVMNTAVVSGTRSEIFQFRPGVPSKNGHNNTFDVEPNTKYKVSVWVRAGGTYVSGTPAVSLHTQTYGADGSYEVGSAVFSPATPTLVHSTWYEVKHEFTTGLNASSVLLRIYSNQPGAVRVDSPMLVRDGASLIATGGITTDHLNVTQEMVAKLLSVRKVQAGEIETNSLAADSGFIGSLRTYFLYSDVFSGKAFNGGIFTGSTLRTSATPSATGGVQVDVSGIRAWNTASVQTFNLNASNGALTVIGGTLTGPTIQTTATADRGLKLTTAGLVGYDGNGNQTFNLNASTGNVSVVGRYSSGVSGNRWVIVPMQDSADGTRAGIWLTNSTAGIGGEETAGMYMDRPNVTFAQPMNIRGMNGGGVNIYGRLNASDMYSGVILNNNGLYKLQGANGSFFMGSLEMHGRFFAKNTPATTQASNAHIATADGLLYKVSSASRYKVDARPMLLPDELLDVPVEDWIDRGQLEERAAMAASPQPYTQEIQDRLSRTTLDRVPGAIAEKVEAAGGREFVTYGRDGLIESISYDRFALARTAILKRQLDAAVTRIEVLEGLLT